MTIEERAKGSRATRRREQIDNNASTEKFMGDVYEHGYINGATDQQQIDTDKACDLLITALNEGMLSTSDIGKLNMWLRKSMGGDNSNSLKRRNNDEITTRKS